MSGALAVLNWWGQGLLESWEPREQEKRDACTVGGSWGDAGLCLQMYGSQDGDIDEDTLSSILKTALGVAELSVTSLFQAIDQEGTGRITFGEWPRHGGGGPRCTGVCPGGGARGRSGSSAHACSPGHGVVLCSTKVPEGRFSPKPSRDY